MQAKAAKAAQKLEGSYPLARIVDVFENKEEEVLPGKKLSAHTEGDKLIVVMFDTPSEIKKFIETLEMTTDTPAMKAIFIMPKPNMQIMTP